MTALRRADAVIVTRAAGVDETLSRAIEPWHGAPPVAWAHHAWRSFTVVEGGEVRSEPVTWMQDRRVVTCFGVGHPTALLAQLMRAGGHVVRNVTVPDHATYDPALLEEIEQSAGKAEAVVTTLKDWVKIDRVGWSSEMPIVIPDLEIAFRDGEEALRRRLLDVVGR